jgi:hypothetical protein
VGRRDYKAAAQLFTFLVVALTLVVFRADSLSAAGHVYSSIFVWNGLQFSPAYLATLNGNRNLELASMLFGGNYEVSVVFVLLALALAACWFLPSTYQLFRHCEVAIDKPLAGRDAVLKLQWSANRAWSIGIALLATASILNLSDVSEFLYFQF